MGQQMHMINETLREEGLSQRGEPDVASPQRAVARHRVKTDVQPAATVNADTFRNALREIFDESKGSFVDVTSRDLHRRVGGYLGRNHRMATCCNVMMAAKRSDDTILAKPPKGRGATLTIRYVLPR